MLSEENLRTIVVSVTTETYDEFFCGTIELGAQVQYPPLKFVVLLILSGDAGQWWCTSLRGRVTGELGLASRANAFAGFSVPRTFGTAGTTLLLR